MKYEFLGTEGHGKTLHDGRKESAIAITDHDGHTDYIIASPWSEAEAVRDYFKNWKADNSRIDFAPILTGGGGSYRIRSAEDANANFDDEKGYDFSSVENFVTA